MSQLISHGVPLDVSRLFPKAKESTTQRQFIKKIKTGGTPLSEIFRDAKVQSCFSTIKRITKKKPEKTYAFGDDKLAVFTPIIYENRLVKNKKELEVTTNFNQVEKRYLKEKFF